MLFGFRVFVIHFLDFCHSSSVLRLLLYGFLLTACSLLPAGVPPSAAVEHAEHHERQLDDKFQNKPEYGCEQNHGKLENSEISLGLGNAIPEFY